MKQSLHLKVGQQLTMTPQLQQAIRLLQLSSIDLQHEIQEALYSNPLLELADDSNLQEKENHSENEGISTPAPEPSSTPQEQEQSSPEQWPDEIPTDLPVDTNWDDIFAANTTSTSSVKSGESRDVDTFQASGNDLLEHLEWQLNLSHLSELDRHIGSAIIDAVGEDGLLTVNIEDIWQGINAQLDDKNTEIDLDEVIAVLHQIQNFDPPGIAAQDLRECLLIQLRQLSNTTPYMKEACLLVDKYLDKIAERDFKFLERKTGFKTETLQLAIEFIQTLSPRPGELLQYRETEYVVPDVRVYKSSNTWKVALNKETTPVLQINKTYAQMIRRADNSEQNKFLRDNLQDAKMFLRSLDGRNDTLLRVSTAIVLTQKEFLVHGDTAMKPLILAEIAEQLELHESTVSRVTTQKFIDTPQGVYELKHFFSSHVGTTEEGQYSSTAIRAMIRTMINDENSDKPLSDSKITAMLGDSGIKVARRTVAKYRESLNIPSSNERKRYKHKQ